MTTLFKTQDTSTLTEMDLLKSVLHKLAQLERTMVKKEDVSYLNNAMSEAIEQMSFLHEDLEALKTSVEVKHIENINSDEVILHSFMEMAHHHPSKF
ncbi:MULTISPECIES: hypothetical protein [Alteribacter]|uniref:Uncharacterized protein n=1 Tax=Alteribacter keqinensis TaxID=2483800 RepID=A0A3M7TT72_9BACI|nr:MULTISPECIES: hypothetical protein [Alteribacter]MBM7096872.1 hypothetical protein [Alteribacter salitolerans]RNA67543.1 hypothetical protein EBO34_12505 [Alteribacter keqinensis]